MMLAKVGCPFYKTSDDGADGHESGEGPMRKVEFRGGFLAGSSLHPQQESKMPSMRKSLINLMRFLLSPPR
jgi:hypothetical protein